MIMCRQSSATGRRLAVVPFLFLAHCLGLRAGSVPLDTSDSIYEHTALTCNASGTVEAPNVTQTCRVVFVVNGAKLTHFNVSCAPGTVEVRLGQQLLNRIQNRGSFVAQGVNISIISRGAAAAPPPDSGGVNGQQDAADDWGIDILNISHLQLVDSVVRGAPLSTVGPLLQCLRCDHLTVRNLTLEDLAAPVTLPPPSPPPEGLMGSNDDLPSEPWHGAVRFTTLSTAVLDRIKCSGVRYASVWACVCLEMNRNSSKAIIRNSEFSDNIVSDSYGAVLARGNLTSDPVSSSMQVLNTTFSDNQGGSGAGISVIMSSLQLMLANSNFTGNTAARSGGGVYVETTKTADFVVCGTVLGFNKAAAMGGAAAFELTTGKMSIHRSDVLHNQAGDCGGAVYVNAQANFDLLDIQGSNVSYSSAGNDGGALFINAQYGTDGITFNVGTKSQLSNNSGRIGGALYLNADNLISGVIDGGSIFSGNVAQSKGGALFVAAPSILQFIMKGSSSMVRNRAEAGGAVFLNTVHGPIESLEILDSAAVTDNVATAEDGGAIFAISQYIAKLLVSSAVVSSNVANRNGGGISISSTFPGRSRVIIANGSDASRNVASAGGFLSMNAESPEASGDFELEVSDSTIADNSATTTDGGGILLVGNRGISVNLQPGSSLARNNASAGKGGAVCIQGGSYQLFASGSHLVNNYAEKDGGGVYASANTEGTNSVIVSNASRVAGNEGGGGGGMYAEVISQSGSLSVVVTGHSSFEDNHAKDNGGAMQLAGPENNNISLTWDEQSVLQNNTALGGGGGVHIRAIVTTVLVNGSSIWSSNNAALEGGAMYVNTSAGEASSVTFCGAAEVRGNRARSGGGIFVDGFVRVLMAENSTFANNTADLDGGLAALNKLPSSLRVESCTIRENKATRGSGGAFFIAADETGGECVQCAPGGGSVVSLSTTHMTENSAGFDGGAVHILAGESCCLSKISLLFDGVKVEDNHADGAGGAVALMNYGREVEVYADLQNSQAKRNTAGTEAGSFTHSSNFGGALVVWCPLRRGARVPCNLNASYSVFESNMCTGGSGGAIMLISCASRLTNVSFQHNWAMLSGGAVASMHVPRRTSIFGLTASSLANSSQEGGLQQSPSMRHRRLLQSRRRTLRSALRSYRPVGYALLLAALPQLSHRRHVRGDRWRAVVPRNMLSLDMPWQAVATSCSFVNNTAQLELGGAVYLDISTEGTASIERCTLKGNVALQQQGGGLFLAAEGQESLASVQDTYFDHNVAAMASAGAMYLLLGPKATGDLKGVDFKSNIASNSGGACVLDVRGGASLSVQDVSALSNQAVRGGGGALQLLLQSNGTTTFVDCIFNDNVAASNGGAVLVDGSCDSSLELSNSNMSGNQARASGGAVYLIYHGLQWAREGAVEPFGPAPVPAEVRSGVCPDPQPPALSSLQFVNNKAGTFGGAICTAPDSTVELRGMNMSSNVAGAAGGSLAGVNCSSLSLLSSNITHSQAGLVGGALYADGCRQLLLEWVRVVSNLAGAAGGGVAIAGLPSTSPVQEPSLGPSFSGDADGTNDANNDFTAAVLSRTQVHGNAVSNNLAQGHCAAGVDGMGGCGGNRWSLNIFNQGGGLFITGRVVSVLNQCDLENGNTAVFGAALASTQQCFPSSSVSVVNAESNFRIATWDALQRIGRAHCWLLHLTDTRLPHPNTNQSNASPELQQALPLWMEDLVASPLYPDCSRINDFLPAGDIIGNEEYDEGGVWKRVLDTLRDSINRATNPSLPSSAGTTPPQVSELGQNKSSRWAARFRWHKQRLVGCIRDPARNVSLLQQALEEQPYMGLPPTSMALEWAGPTYEIGNTSRPILHAGSFFNVAVQLKDAYGQRLSLDAMSSEVTLAIKPAPPGGAQGFAMTPPLQDINIANLDPGLNKSAVMPVIGGVAEWTRVTARGWPNDYYLTFVLTSSSRSNFTVAPLQGLVSLLPCAVGQTLDLDTVRMYSRPSWTGCQACGSGQYGLWEDTRKHLWQWEQLDYYSSMNSTVNILVENDAACQPCPPNAECTGGAVIAPKPGYWHSAANSTQIHACPNRKACGSRTTTGRSLVHDDTGAFVDQEEFGRTRSLVDCQKAWYASEPPGAAVLAAFAASQSNASESTSGALETAPSSPPPPDSRQTYSSCLLWGTAPGDANSYMQMQCETGYTGTLCAACIPGYYVDSDFNCKKCASVAYTVGLGLVSFFSSVVLVIFTAMTNFSEGFGQQADMQPTEGELRRKVELGDVVKVIVLHIQYLVIVTRLSVDYPGVIRDVQAVFSTITGAENYLVYSPSCLRRGIDSAGQAMIQFLAGILTPCAVVLVAMILWALRYYFPSRQAMKRAIDSRRQRSFKSVGPRNICCWLGRPLRSKRSGLHNVERSPPPPSIPSRTTSIAGPVAGFGGATCNGRSANVLHSAIMDITWVAFENTDDIAAQATVAGTDVGGEGLPNESATPTLPAAASVTAVEVDFKGLDLGTAASAPDPPGVSTVRGPDMVALKLGKVREMGVVREEYADDMSELDLRADGASTARYAPGDPSIRHSSTFGPGGLYTPRSMPTGAFGHHQSWHRKGTTTLSQMGSEMLTDTVKALKKIAVNTHLSNHATLNNVDKALTVWEQLGVVLMAAVFILYPSWAHAALSAFACYKVDDSNGLFSETQQATWNYGYWVRDMQAQCFSGDHLRIYVPIGVVSVVIFCLAPPLASFWFVWRVRGQLKDVHVRKVYGFLYKRYKTRFIWWETALQLETLVLVSVEVLGRGLTVSYQALLLLAVFTVIAAINITCAPLLSRLLVIMEFMSLATLSLTITLSLYFTVDGSLNEVAENALAVIIIVLNACLLVFFLYVAGQHYWLLAFRRFAPKAQAALQSISSVVSGYPVKDQDPDTTESLGAKRGRFVIAAKLREHLKGVSRGQEAAETSSPAQRSTGTSNDLVPSRHVSFTSASGEISAADTAKGEAHLGCYEDCTSGVSREPMPTAFMTSSSSGHVYIGCGPPSGMLRGK